MSPETALEVSKLGEESSDSSVKDMCIFHDEAHHESERVTDAIGSDGESEDSNSENGEDLGMTRECASDRFSRSPPPTVVS